MMALRLLARRMLTAGLSCFGFCLGLVLLNVYTGIFSYPDVPRSTTAQMPAMEQVAAGRAQPAVLNPAHPAELSVFVQLGKCGSSTMRSMLASLPDSRLCYMTKSLAVEMHKNRLLASLRNARIGNCIGSPAGTVMLGADLGYCELVANTRSCRYFTAMREPISRLLSQYDYFCRDCNDRRKFCGAAGMTHVPKPVQRGCSTKTLSFLGWISAFPEQYVRLFSNNWQQLESGYYRAYTSGFQGMDAVTEAEYQNALSLLRNPNRVFIAWTEKMDLPETWANLSIYLGHQFRRNASRVNKSKRKKKQKYVPTQEELNQVRKMNAFDMRLYDALASS